MAQPGGSAVSTKLPSATHEPARPGGERIWFTINLKTNPKSNERAYSCRCSSSSWRRVTSLRRFLIPNTNPDS